MLFWHAGRIAEATTIPRKRRLYTEALALKPHFTRPALPTSKPAWRNWPEATPMKRLLSFLLTLLIFS